MQLSQLGSPLLVATTCFLYACGGGGGESQPPQTPEPPVSTPDTTAPVITLNGDASIHHEQGTEYQESGASAQDDIDGAVNVDITGSVGTAAGEYELTYTATDTAGNTASITRLVAVSDTRPPVITLLGSQNMVLEQGTAYTEDGATALDLVDGEVNVIITGTVGNELTTYTLTYTATDTVGNSAELARSIEIVEAAEPPSEDNLIVFANGELDSQWDRGINAFDEDLDWGECNNDEGAGCPSIGWQVVNDDERGNVLEISHSDSGKLAGLFFASSSPQNLSDYAQGSITFDVKNVSGDSKITMKLDCEYPCTSGDQNLGNKGESGWETVEISMATLKSSGLDLSKVNTGLVIWATDATSTVFRIDNVKYIGKSDNPTPPEEPQNPPVDYNITRYGAGSVSDTINPASYRCVYDYGNWIFNAGVVEPGIAGCDTSNGSPGTPIGEPTKLYPQLTGPAASKPTPTHKWWGSIPFLGEMTIGDPNSAAYITPDPIMARVTNKGVRVISIPAGLKVTNENNFQYAIPDPFAEVMDGIAIANSEHDNLNAFLKDHSDASVTVEWQSGETPVMEATFIHGSPYVYFKAHEGNILVRTLREDGGEKGTFYQKDNSLGVWTSVAGQHNNFIITGEGETTFDNVSSNEITVTNAAKEITLVYLPQNSANPDTEIIDFFVASARNVVAKAEIDYSVNRANNEVTVSHRYLNSAGEAVETIAGMHPLHWKNSDQVTSDYNIRSARGTIKFTQTSGFDYKLPYLGVLPTLPSFDDTYNIDTLTLLVREFVDAGADDWILNHDGIAATDAYWAGKNYSKVAELVAIADSVGLHEEATTLRNWLKDELANWFTAETDGALDINKYFVYDSDWNTLLALEESFMSHQQLNDHHFHYGYLIRAAAEICRADASWCGDEQYGPMIELLIRDYAADKDDEMFPYLRNFDPANGFSWASGRVNFSRGNNNESTSEAANAYGAIVLYGLITNKQELVDRGMYLHASTTAAYWEYWNNIDGYRNTGSDENNFPSGYNRITTSIIWGDGAAFSTWFSAAFAHILGIQGLPVNSLVLHVGLHEGYMKDYVALGLSESSNNKPSGLEENNWRDIWWNLWAMTDADAALADYLTVSSYKPEVGETKAHTYHWLHTYTKLGHLITGTGALTANHPAALAFKKDGTISYVVYNFSDSEQVVTYSDGQTVTAEPNGFTVISKSP